MRGKLILLAFAAIVLFAGVLGTVFAPSVARPAVWALIYPAFHAGWWHLASSVLCLAAIIKSDFRIPVLWPLAAFALSCVALPLTGHTSETCGASGVIYALLGAMSWQSYDIRRYHVTIGFVALASWILPVHVNVALHVVCYVGGVLLGRIWRVRL